MRSFDAVAIARVPFCERKQWPIVVHVLGIRDGHCSIVQD